MICVNVRTLSANFSGVQRYSREVVRRMHSVRTLSPSADWALGVKGHLWEQLVLPFMISPSDVLFSPGNVGPLMTRNQIVVIHDMATFAHPEWFTGLFSNWYRFLLPLLVRRSAHVITVSSCSKNEIRKYTGVSKSKISVVVNGIEISGAWVGLNGGDLSDDVRSVVQAERPYCLYVGSWEPRKNLSRLLEAWRTAGIEDLNLVLCGGGVSRVFGSEGVTECFNDVVKLGRVTDLELVYLLENAKFFVYPSLYEGFGLPPVEAMSLGCPVLVSNIDSLREVCGESAQSGGAVEFCDPLSAKSISDGLKRLDSLLDSERSRRVQKGREIASRFRWGDSALRVRKIVDSFVRHQNFSKIL